MILVLEVFGSEGLARWSERELGSGKGASTKTLYGDGLNGGQCC